MILVFDRSCDGILDPLRVEQGVIISNQPFELKNVVFCVKIGDLRTRYGGATLALLWRYAGLTDSMTPNGHQISQTMTLRDHPCGQKLAQRVQNVVANWAANPLVRISGGGVQPQPYKNTLAPTQRVNSTW